MTSTRQLLTKKHAIHYPGMAAVPGLVRIDNSQASPYGYEGHASGQQQPWGEQDFQGRSRIDRGRQGYAWQAQPMVSLQQTDLISGFMCLLLAPSSL